MDGESFLRAMQAHPSVALRAVPVIVLTASRRRTTLPGCVTWLDKPIDIDRLLQLCAEYVGPVERTAPPSAEPAHTPTAG